MSDGDDVRLSKANEPTVWVDINVNNNHDDESGRWVGKGQSALTVSQSCQISKNCGFNVDAIHISPLQYDRIDGTTVS